MGDTGPDLRTRSIRTLAWIGDAEFERELRLELARRGDYSTDRLDTARAMVARAEAQAALLEAIEAELKEDEREVVGRARNTSLSASGRQQRDVKAYRAATALEALVAYWLVGDARDRFETLLVPHLHAAIDRAITRSQKPRRG